MPIFRIFFVIILLISSPGKTFAYDQLLTDVKAMKIPDSETRNADRFGTYLLKNFSTPKERVRAIYYWITHKVSYNLGNTLYAFNASREPVVIQTLNSRQGNCVCYSETFSALCKRCGIQSEVIEGIVFSNGSIANIGHAWVAAFIDGSWKLFDPTWGAGYSNGTRYVSSPNDTYYEVSPLTMIKTHYPYNPAWQLMSSPLTSKEFKKGRTVEEDRGYNFLDSLKSYYALSSLDRVRVLIRRIEENGTRHRLLRKFVSVNKKNLETIAYNSQLIVFNRVIGNLNLSVNLLNGFFQYQNKNFQPRNSKSSILAMLDRPEKILTSCKNELLPLESGKTKRKARKVRRKIENLLEKIQEEHELVEGKF